MSFLILAAVLTGCAFFRVEKREAWRGEAERACVKSGRVFQTPHVRPLDKISGPGVCGVDMPLKVGATQDASVAIQPGATLACPMTSALDHWVHEAVQPAAYTWFGMPVVSMKNAASYGCRTRNHKRGAKLSEHAFANAVDIASFTLANGRVIVLKTGWRGAPDEQAFLRQVFVGACGRFKTVLGPGSDGMHEDHFHLDLARHNAKGTAYCRPRTESLKAPETWPPYAWPQDVPAGPRKW